MMTFGVISAVILGISLAFYQEKRFQAKLDKIDKHCADIAELCTTIEKQAYEIIKSFSHSD